MKKLQWKDLSQEDKDIIDKKLFWRKWLLGLFLPGLALLWTGAGWKFVFVIILGLFVWAMSAGWSDDVWDTVRMVWYIGIRIYVISNFSKFSFNYSKGFVR